MTTDGHRPIRILHTSDVHLGAFRADPDGHQAERRNEVHDAFTRAIDVAIDEAVDLVLIAGDFFDNARVDHGTIRFAVEQLARLPVPAVILPGNHDHMGHGSIYARIDLPAETGNVRMISTNEGETLRFPDLDLALWGRAHNERPDALRPLETPPPRGAERWQVAIAHGHYVPPGEWSTRSYLIHADEIEASDRDYVALGHWEHFHAVRRGPVTACYSGAPTPMATFSERLTGLVALVTLDPEAGVSIEGRSIRGNGAAD